LLGSADEANPILGTAGETAGKLTILFSPEGGTPFPMKPEVVIELDDATRARVCEDFDTAYLANLTSDMVL